MRLLIAYDGSKSAEAAIDDLALCGLPPSGEAKVLSVAEVWLPPPDTIDGSGEETSAYIESIVREHREKGERMLASASILAKHASSRVKTALRDWDVTSDATFGSPAWGILEAAEAFEPDLIIVGAQGHSVISSFLLGSTSQTVLTEAKCSVRVARGKNELDPGLGRILIGFDGSKGAAAAVNAVATRKWMRGTEAKLLAVTEPSTPSSIGRFVTPIRKAVADVETVDEKWLGSLVETAAAKLRNAGIDTQIHMCPGNPKDVIVHEAQIFGADAIFIGANALGGRLARLLLGSTASAVSARAHCSVEVVRIPDYRRAEIDPGSK
ncbi:MAG: Universal stress protein UspA-like nucleotide-binding protein [Acidobacteria bacterium OLB17]|nr:MAG: Universal stress protein UspA-like nucleotide-binding protein [Acidobacteria bacterium OLB17]MCZ2391498.1 universal stress protein [Acidobacteriota bacterium]